MHPISPAVLEAARLAVCAAWLVAMPLLTRGVVERLRRFTSRDIRVRVWRRDMAISWAAALLALACAGGLDVFAAGHANVAGPAIGAMTWAVLRPALFAVLVALFALQAASMVRGAFDARRRARMAAAFQSMRWMLPASAIERRWWLAVSLTAGITEEIVARGCLLPDLQGASAASPLLHMPLWAAWASSSLVFGFAHLYQGAQGVARATTGGLFMGALAILSGGLAVPIVAHVLADALVVFMYRPDEDHPEEAARLVEGCAPEESGPAVVRGGSHASETALLADEGKA